MPWIQTGLIIAGGVAAAGIAVYVIFSISHKNRNNNMAKDEFASCADTFSGLYEPLYLMSIGKIKYRTGILGDFAARTANLGKAPHYREVWNRKLDGCTQWEQGQGLIELNELITFIQSSGICRGSLEPVIVDNSTYKKYETADEDRIEEGQSARVIHPYWSIGDKILEKGTIEKVD